jgi:hypothetical protein
MRSTLMAMSVTTVVVAAGLSACGGSDEPTDSTADAVAGQVQEICDERALSFAARGEFPVDDFDPESPDPADLPAVGDYFAAGLTEPPRAIAELEGIAATGEQREQLDALIEAWEAEYAGLRAQVDAALGADAEAFVATLDDAAASKAAVDDAATALGVPDCGQG